MHVYDTPHSPQTLADQLEAQAISKDFSLEWIP